MKIFICFPLLIVILFPLKLILTYILALYYGHIKPVFPYISDAGTTSPEAGYFSLFLFFEALLIAITNWIRFQQIKYICNLNINHNNNKILETDNIPKLMLFNKLAFGSSVIIILSIPIVAAFRSSENLSLHLLGALPTFGFSFAYLFLQTKISYFLIPKVNSLRIARMRYFFTILAFIFGSLMFFCLFLSSIDLKVPIDKVTSEERLFWDPSYGGYIEHCLSAFFEWLAIFIISPFYATFIPEFNNIESHNGKIKYKIIQTTNDNQI